MLKFNFSADELQNNIMESAAARIVGSVKDTKCPEHGKTATITAKGGSPDKLTFEISDCCCEKLRSLIGEKLS